MKLLHLSLAVLISMGTCAFGADTLQDAFKNGTFDGELRFAYMAGSKSDVGVTQGTTSDKDSGAVGVQFNYKTADFNNFKLGLGFQASHDLGFHGADGSTQDDTRLTVSVASLTQAYLEYNFTKDTNVKVGRQFIYSPLLNNLTVYIFPLADSFDAVTVTSKDIPQTTVQVAYVKEWNKLWDGADGDNAIFGDTHFKDGLYSIYVNNKSVSGLTLEGQYMDANMDATDKIGDLPVNFFGGYKQYLTRATYKLPLAFPLSVGGYYTNANYDLSSLKDADGYGVIFKTNVINVDLSAAYTSVSDDADLPGTLGSSPDMVSYTKMLINNVIFAGMDSYSVEARHKFSDQLTGGMKYAYMDQSSKGYTNTTKKVNKADEINFDLRYDFSGELNGLNLHTFLGYADYDLDVAKDDVFYGQLYVTYKF